MKDRPRKTYIGEDLVVSVRVENPYKMPLEIKEFWLEYEISSEEESKEEGSKIKTIESEKLAFTLGEVEKKNVTITLKPDVLGKIRGSRKGS